HAPLLHSFPTRRSSDLAPERERRPPVRLGRGQLQHPLVAGRLAEQRTPVLVRILAGQVGQLVDEALDDETVLRRADRAPEPEREDRKSTRLNSSHGSNS